MRGIVRITGKTVGVTALVGFAVAIALLLIIQPKLLFPPEGFGKDLPPVRDFSHLGMSGELKLYFFRDRLMRSMAGLAVRQNFHRQ